MAKKIIKKSNNPITEIGMIKTVLGKNTHFNGVLNFSTSLQINGVFEGEIDAPKGYLIVGQDAKVKANIKTKTAVIGGEVEGDVIATEKLELLSTARLIGNIKTARLKIADGVIFEGNCETIKEDEKSE